MTETSPADRVPALVLWTALVLCTIKGLVTAYVTPPFQTPDEYGHYDYVLYLSYVDWSEFLGGRVARPTGYNDVTTAELWAVTAATGTESHLRGKGLQKPLPAFRDQYRAAARFRATDTHEALSRKAIVAPQFNYPVLYYGGVSLLPRSMRAVEANPVVVYHVVRLCSLLLLLGTVVLTWRMLLDLFPGRHGSWAVAAGTAFVAMQPQLTMLGTSVQSDMLTVFLTSAALACGVRGAVKSGRRIWLAGGLICGALLLTKLHAALAVGVGFSALLTALAFVDRSKVRLAPLAGFWAVVTTVGGWWYVRAYVLYGSYTGMVGTFRTAPFGTPRQNIRWWLEQWQLTYKSFWGMWGWLEVPLPPRLYATLGLLTVVTAGLASRRLAGLLRRGPFRLAMTHVLTVTLAYACIMVIVAAVVGPVHNNQGRHWLPLIGVVAVVVGVSAHGRGTGGGSWTMARVDMVRHPWVRQRDLDQPDASVLLVIQRL